MAQNKNKNELKTTDLNDILSDPPLLKKQASYHQMISEATRDRLRELKKMDSSRGRASCDIIINGSPSNDPYARRSYSLANTNTKHLNKVKQDIQQQYEHQRAKKKHKLKRFISSQKNLHQTDNDEDDDDDKKEHELSPVPLANNNHQIKSKTETETQTKATLNKLIRRSRRPHIINPCVPVTGSRHSNKNGTTKRHRKFKFGQLFGGFGKNTAKEELIFNEEAPKRVIYSLENDKYELYPWLKPTKCLGQGAYAIVCEVKDIRTKLKYAIKKNRDVFNNVADARRILREIKLMIHMHHDNVMGLVGCIPPEHWEINTFNEVYLVMKRCDTTLKRVIRSRQALTEQHIMFFGYQIARALEYMHSGNIIHRDLKPENILVDIGNCRIRITDFGLARGVYDDVDTPQQLTEYVVTRWYRAPEVMCCKKMYEARIDVWSLGCIMAEMYKRKPLWKGKHSRDQLQLIFGTLGTPTDTEWITTPSQKQWIQQQQPIPPTDLRVILPGSTALARSFIEHMLIMNPHERPTISQVINHPFLASRRKDKHYKLCKKFNISFEFEKKIKTTFGVRHMMYEELLKFHKLVEEQNKMDMIPNKCLYPSFGFNFAQFNDAISYEMLITGYINHISDTFNYQITVPLDIAKLICLYSSLCLKLERNPYYKIYGALNSCIERISNDCGCRNIFNTTDIGCKGNYVWKFKVKKANTDIWRSSFCEIGVIASCFLKQQTDKDLEKSFRKYRRFGYGKQMKINDVRQIISVCIDFEYTDKKGLLAIYQYPDENLMRADVSSSVWQCMIPKNTKYRCAVCMEKTGIALEMFNFQMF